MSLQLLWSDLVVLVATCKNIYLSTTGKLDCLGVGSPVGGGNQNLIAIIEGNLEGSVDSLLAAVGDQNLRGVNLGSGVAESLLRDCLAHFREADSWCVAVVFWVTDCPEGCLDYVLGSLEVRFSCGIRNYGPALGL